MSAKEVTINYLKSIKLNYKGILKDQMKHNVSDKYTFETMEYLVGIDLAIKAAEEMEGE